MVLWLLGTSEKIEEDGTSNESSCNVDKKIPANMCVAHWTIRLMFWRLPASEVPIPPASKPYLPNFKTPGEVDLHKLVTVWTKWVKFMPLFHPHLSSPTRATVDHQLLESMSIHLHFEIASLRIQCFMFEVGASILQENTHVRLTSP